MSQFIEMFGTINSPCDKMSTLGELCHIHRGGSPRPIKDYITTDANGLNWIKIGDTDDSMYIKKTEEKIKPSGLKKTRQVYAGDLLLSNSMSFGRPYILKINGCIHDGWLVLHIKDESILTQIYLCAYLSQKSTYEEMSKLAAGGVVQNLNSEIVKKLPVILPPMQKQLEYISILEQADKSEFGGFKSQFIEMFGDCKTNTKNYPIKKVGDFADCFAGATPSTKISAYWDNCEIPWMSSGEVHKGRVKDTDAKISQQGYDGCSTKMVPIHSVVVALAGQGKTRGTVAINDIELCTNQSLCAIVPNEEVNYEYLYHNLKGRYKELRSMSGDVDGRGGLNLKHIQSIRIVVPPMEEQLKFVSIAQQADKSEKCCEIRLAS